MKRSCINLSHLFPVCIAETFMVPERPSVSLGYIMTVRHFLELQQNKCLQRPKTYQTFSFEDIMEEEINTNENKKVYELFAEFFKEH